MLWLINLGSAWWTVIAEMAPYLLFGFLMAGLLSVFISPEWIERHLGGRGLLPIIKAAAFGVPLPLCSCGVIPVTASIRGHGASRGATVGFLLSTPQTGVDSILATYALLGPVFAIYRPVVAFLTGIAGGFVASIVGEKEDELPGHAAKAACTDASCAKQPQSPAILRALRYGFITLPADLAKALLFGVLIAGLMSVFLSEDLLAPYLGGGIAAMFIMIAVGIPIYVCSTASIPIALGFMHLGVSPGAALAFLISGPATNAASIAVVWKILGRRTAIIYLLTVAIGALAAGLSLDALYAFLPAAHLELSQHMHHHGLGWLNHLSAVVLLLLLTANLLKPALRVRLGAVTQSEGKPSMQKTVTLKIDGMSCSHCVNTVARTLRGVAGVEEAQVDLSNGQALVSGNDFDNDALTQAVRDLGYEVFLAGEHSGG